MMKVKIDQIQFFSMIPNLVYGKAIGITAGIFARRIGADVWSSMIIGFLLGTLIVMCVIYIGSKFPEKTIIQYSEELLGTGISKIIGLILCVFFAIAYMISANVITLHLKEYLLTDTPFIVLCLLYTLLILYGVILGIEVIVRFSFFGIVMTLLLDISMVVGVMNKFRIRNLLPILDTGIISNISNSIYLFSDLAMVIFAVGMIYPMLNKKKHSGKLTLGAMALCTALVVVWPITEVGVMGADVMKKFVVVCMQQARNAQLTMYMPRYELIMVIFFVWGMVVQSAVMMYSCVYSFKQASGVSRDKGILIPLVPVLILGTYVIGYDHNQYVQFIASPWSQICAVLSIGIPLLLLIAYVFRNKEKEDRKKQRKKEKIKGKSR